MTYLAHPKNLYQQRNCMATRRNKARSGAVRREQFERSLDAMNYEMSLKTAESMAKYHTAYVEPIEKRLRTIELLLGLALARWCYWKLDSAWHWLYMKFTKSVPDSEGEENIDPDAAPRLLEALPNDQENEIKQAVRSAYPH
jgi:hypothetical protein